MKITKSFGYPVTQYGLPRNWCTTNPTGSENLRDLTIQEITTTFWLLESINTRFAYYINNSRYEREIILNSDVEPYNRMAQDPVFQYYNEDSDDIESYFALELWSIAAPSSFTGTADLRFSATERDNEQLFIFTCDDVPNYHLLDERPFKLLERDLSMKLWSLSAEWQGYIEYFEISTDYYYPTDKRL